ncbi:lanthionine synthetase C family protein [Flagellimonas flava]|uniref:Lanthionine synthetase C-like protein n=1 Tax=Flagellimonas flava TaxID=570519 RepID=A0A1M5LZV7_9FLAO|nr:lanthionine synthetase C family protein [Allomuricauda flava]SHG70470.1 Lanthionine synthetase C-like protein [Allomuricauda flava]
MNIRTTLKEKLTDISQVVQEKYSEEKDIGVLAGISGCAMFQFYYAQYLNSEKQMDLGLEMISLCIDKMNKGYTYSTYCSGIAGMGWTVQHLAAEGFIEVDCDDFLAPFDEYLFTCMKSSLLKGDYDFLHGAIGYGFYFFKRYKHTQDEKLKKRYRTYLTKLILQLDSISIVNDDMRKWQSILYAKNNAKVYNLGLSHGMSSILNFLTRVSAIDEVSDSSIKMVEGILNYLQEQKNPDDCGLSVFPNWVEPGHPVEYNGRIAWCYGDLGIGISLLQTAKERQDMTLEKYATQILLQTSERKEPNETKVVDAGICHGSFGNALIYNKLHKLHHSHHFKSSAAFWIKDGIEKACHANGYAGYMQWDGDKLGWNTKLSLLDGVAGIGLAIMDYLSEKQNNWDECLML